MLVDREQERRQLADLHQLQDCTPTKEVQSLFFFSHLVFDKTVIANFSPVQTLVSCWETESLPSCLSAKQTECDRKYFNPPLENDTFCKKKKKHCLYGAQQFDWSSRPICKFMTTGLKVRLPEQSMKHFLLLLLVRKIDKELSKSDQQ